MVAPHEFVSEAQDVLETFSRSLFTIDHQLRNQELDAEQLQQSFRAMHSLKGLAGLFGATTLGELSHHLETILDHLRLGRLSLDRQALDVLFESIELCEQLVRTNHSQEAEQKKRIQPFLHKLQQLANRAKDTSQKIDISWLGHEILSVLTNYEEHRLRESLRTDNGLFRIHANFAIATIDTELDRIREKLKPYGEVLAYLPGTGDSAGDRLAMDVLFGSRLNENDILNKLQGVEELRVDRIRKPQFQDKMSENEGELTDLEAKQTSSSVLNSEIVVNEHALEKEKFSLRSFSQTVRVDLRRLDELMNLVGELGVVHHNLTDVLEQMRRQLASSEQTRALEVQAREMARKLNLLQQGILDIRMVPIGQIFDKVARVVRNLSRDLTKDIRLELRGTETVLDKLIVEELSDPLMHMIRNCIDHGIEPASTRIAAKKPPVGRIELRAFQQGNRVIIEVEDDGAGMDWQMIREIAQRRGIITAEEAAHMSAPEALNLIFVPGFSTRYQASQISGRGVGMDVVKTNIAKLSGMIDVHTKLGEGTRFSITLPVTLAIVQALIIESAKQVFCIPLSAVLESVMVDASELKTIEGHEVIRLHEKVLPLLRLSEVFELPREHGYHGHLQRLYVVVIGLAQHRIGLVVDDLLGQQDVVIKPLGKAIRNVPGIAGATELGANQTVLILDVARLVEEASHASENSFRNQGN